MTDSELPSSQVWRNRAEECRVLGESFHSRVTRERMLRVARDYERMAIRAAARELTEAQRGGPGVET